MDVVYGLIPMMLIFGALVVGVFIWMAKAGHFDDLDGAAHSIFLDDEYPEDKVQKQTNKPTQKSEEASEPNILSTQDDEASPK